VCIGVGIIPSWSWQGCLCQRCSSLPLAGPAELFQLVADHIEEVTRPLRDEAAASKLWVASAAGSWEHAEAASAGGVGRALVRASDARLRDAELLEFVGSCLPIHRFHGSSLAGFDAFSLPSVGTHVGPDNYLFGDVLGKKCCSGPLPFLPDASLKTTLHPLRVYGTPSFLTSRALGWLSFLLKLLA
jgi:hypothetical protein